YFNLSLFPKTQFRLSRRRCAEDRCPTRGNRLLPVASRSWIKKSSIVVLVLEPVLHLKLLRLNLFLPQRIMVASTIEIDDVIGILKDRLRRSQSVFTNALELRVACRRLRHLWR